MTRLRRALEGLSERGRPRGADAVLRAAEEQMSAGAGKGGPAAPERSRVLVAAAAVAVLAAGGVGTFLLADDDPIDVTTTPSTSEVTTTTSTPPTSEEPTEPGSTAGMPATWVGQDDEHRLVVVDTASGEVVRVLTEFDDPDGFTERTGEPFAGGSFLGGFDVSPDGGTVFYELCCEPAPGLVYRVPVAGGEPEEVTHGAEPAVSPDGSRLAVVEMQWIKIVDLVTGEEVRLEATGVPPAALRDPAWSPDGRTLVFEIADDDIDNWRLVSLDVDRATSLDDAETVAETDGDGSPGLATFDAEGHLHVVRQQQVATGIDGLTGPEGPARALTLDLEAGTVTHRTLESAVRSQDHDATGSFRIRSFVDGTVRARPIEPVRCLGRCGGAPVDLATGYLAAAW